MASYKFSFVHEALTEIEFQELAGAVRWLLANCPTYPSIPGMPFPNAPLKGQLVTASFQKATSGSGTGNWTSTRLFQHDGTDNPISMVLGTPMIVLCGRKSFGTDYLTIGTEKTNAWQTVDTGGKPYTLVVAATLLLANRISPLWSITSSAPDEVWATALEWVQQYDAGITLPASIAPATQSSTEQIVKLPFIRMPTGLDFRA